MKISLLFLALAAKNKTIDMVTASGRTYQVGPMGMFERLFEADEHPTRRNASDAELQSALDQAEEIQLWTGPTELRVVTEAELESELAPFPIREGGVA